MSKDNLAAGHRERVRAKYAKLGSFDSYAPYEVLEFLLFYAIPRKDTKAIAKNLISVFGSLKGVLSADIKTLEKQPGVGLSTALFLHSISQVSAFTSQESAEQIRGSGDMGTYALELMKGKLVEEFHVVALNAENEIITSEKLATGKFSSVQADIGDVMKFAFINNAEKIVLIHNHPNGSSKPSGNDVNVTRHFELVAKTLDIQLIDHIITGKDGYYSFADNKKIGEKGDWQ